MKKEVELINIYSLKNFINCDYYRKQIQEYFEKRTHSSKVKEYKPESEKWLKAKEEDERIANIPDHKVKFNYDNLILEYSYHKVEFSIGTITIEKTGYCYDSDEYVSGEVTLNFLVENSYWGHGLICTFNELINHDKIQSLFETMLDDQRKEITEKRLASFKDGVFMLLLDKILKSEKNLIDWEIWSSYNDDIWLQIGDQKYYMNDMLVINEAYKNKDYEFYDSDDRKIEYKDYYHESFPDFYLEHSKNNNVSNIE